MFCITAACDLLSFPVMRLCTALYRVSREGGSDRRKVMSKHKDLFISEQHVNFGQEALASKVWLLSSACAIAAAHARSGAGSDLHSCPHINMMADDAKYKYVIGVVLPCSSSFSSTG